MFNKKSTATTVLLFSLSLLSMTMSAADFSIKAGHLALSVDSKGRLTKLADTAKNVNYLASTADSRWKSYLIMCKKYGGDLKAPVKMEILKRAGTQKALLKFSYESGATLTVKIEAKTGYIRMKLVDASPLKDIDTISWGPYKTSMREPVARWLGMNRSDNFTIGCLSLEPNTDGHHGYDPVSAEYQEYGSLIALYSTDHTRPRKIRDHMTSTPIQVTVKGSVVALFGVPRGRDNELDIIEAIELKEGLPHPTFLGKWNKRSRMSRRISLWLGLSQSNADKCVQIAKEMSAGTICRMHGYYSNWGHFDINTSIFPDGRKAVAEVSKKVWKAAKAKNTTYTLSGFLKPMSAPEPFITPKPDPRLAHWDPTTTLVKPAPKDAKEMTLNMVDGFMDIYKTNYGKALQVGNEIIEFKKLEVKGGKLVVSGIQRGALKSANSAHPAGAPVRYMFLSGYHNFYPGTVDMNNEMASYIAKDAVGCGNGVVILDGYESCFETGHQEYALNMFAKTIYDNGGAKDRLMAYSLTQGNYNWHMMSYQSWGEYDLEQGFRGTMLDYRIMRQIQYRDNLVPNKMGQYYPTKASLEDVEWLMARVCGWDSGVDFNIDVNWIRKNPDYKAICDALRLWEDARLKNIFPEKVKMLLRQTDRMYRLKKGSDGKLELEFRGFWRCDRGKMLPASKFSVKPEAGAVVKPLSADWKLTHNPAIFERYGLSDDLVQSGGATPAGWKVTVPAALGNRNKQHMLPLLRIPSNSPCGAKEIRIKVNGGELVIQEHLSPGEYISFPHDVNWGCVYDAKTDNVKREFRAPQFNPCWVLPELKRGKSNKIELECVPDKAGASPTVILNLRCWDRFQRK